ncbi:MAG TPA: tRNA (adenosine(37)-N6)-threonylcarbamoyltransferase complex dimerization subunit type 1 TsaB [Acetobacteraceae bacterium]|jgi:tRNA threonylcarbamoyladenosine biosynthesis protein TsaB|nr:tRNA (adenosine(37)-N6)-threonylcarbamoyltransferase complex dimerization subunit type 1 TsaB [Acetobacteraceae bacterium]
MRILTLDAALARCGAAIVIDQQMVALRQEKASQGHAALLPVMAEAVLGDAALRAADLDLVAVTVGPGSFTGIRAGLALAHGIGRAAGIPVIGVTVGEALADSLPFIGARELWSVTDSRRGRIFLERAGTAIALSLADLPRTTSKVAVAGDAAPAVAAWLAARDVDVMLTDARLPMARHIAVVAEHRHAGRLPPLEAQPLYVDPPEAKLPAGGLRPAPAA